MVTNQPSISSLLVHL